MQHLLFKCFFFGWLFICASLTVACDDTPADPDRPQDTTPSGQAKSCEDLNCAIKNRQCLPANGDQEASCGDCLETAWDSGLSCVPLTQCRENQYETTAPTATSDRICTYLTPCTRDEYESVAATATTDRECAPLTVCDPNEYESIAPTATSDRTCATPTVCTADEYEKAPPTATSDRICEALTQCEPGQWVSTPATPTSDRSCSDMTICEDGDIDVDPTLPTDGTATEDRRCCYHYVVSQSGETFEIVDGDGWPTAPDIGDRCYVLDGSLEIHGTMGDTADIPHLARIMGSVTIAAYTDNTLANFPDLETLDEGLSLLSTSLIDLTSFSSLQRIGESQLQGFAIPVSLYLVTNEALESLRGLQHLQHVPATVYIVDTDNLTSLNGLDGLTSIGGMLEILNNRALTSLNGIEALRRIGDATDPSDSSYRYSLTINENPTLTSVIALSSLSFIKGNLSITNNAKLCSADAALIAARVHKSTPDLHDNNGICLRDPIRDPILDLTP